MDNFEENEVRLTIIDEEVGGSLTPIGAAPQDQNILPVKEEPTVELLAQPRAYVALYESLKNSISLPAFGDAQPWGTMTEGLERPLSFGDIIDRVKHNQSVFRANYLFIVCAFAAYAIFTTPALFLASMAAGGFALYTLYWNKPYEFQLMGRTFTGKSCVVGVTAACLLFTVLSGSIMTLLWTFFVAFVASSAHCILRKVPEENLFDENKITSS